MLKFTLLALLVLIHSSTAAGPKRLLLQGQPGAPAAPANPAAPATPAVVEPVTPATPATPANPVAPVNPVNPVNPVLPSTPVVQQPQVNPQYPGGVPGNPGMGFGGPQQQQPGVAYPPGYVPPPPMGGNTQNLPAFAMPLAEANCEIPYGMPGSCSYRNKFQQCPPTAPPGTCGPITYDRLMDNFKLNCPIPFGCYGSEINMNIGANPMFPMGVRKINQVLASEPSALQSATINIRNMQNNGNNIELSNLECNNLLACTGLTLNVWGVSVNDVNCDQPGNCGGCNINFYTTMRPGCQNMIANPMCLVEAKPCWGY